MRPNKRTVRDAIRGSVPAGKIKGAKIILKDSTLGLPVAGFTEYDREKGGRVIKIGAPASVDAFGITIRGHETRHASRHTPRRKKPMTPEEEICCQIVDDVNIEATECPEGIPGLREYKRAHLTTAMRDLNTIVRKVRAVRGGGAPDTIETRNSNLLAAVRVIGMLRSYGQDDEPLVAVRRRAFQALRNAIGQKTVTAAGLVAQYAKSARQRSKAVSMLLALMEKEPDEDRPEREEGERNPDGDMLLPVTGGDSLDGHMNIIDLKPKNVWCAKEKRVTRRACPSGVIINPTRFVSAIVSGDASGLFSRRIKHKSGGCVVIDASGSMGATARNLSQLCALVPTATVGYYSGKGSGGCGDLCVYADKEKRFSGVLPEEYMHGGNAVDLPAIRWMMRFPKPWILVSDLQFCGGVIGSESVAHAIVEREVKRGTLKVYQSLDEAFAAFGGKGELKN